MKVAETLLKSLLKLISRRLCWVRRLVWLCWRALGYANAQEPAEKPPVSLSCHLMPYGPSHFISPSKGHSQQVTELDLRYCGPCAGLGKNLISARAWYSPPQSDIWLHSEANGIEPSEPVICIGSSQGPRTTPSNASVCCCFFNSIYIPKIF